MIPNICTTLYTFLSIINTIITIHFFEFITLIVYRTIIAQKNIFSSLAENSNFNPGEIVKYKQLYEVLLERGQLIKKK